MGNEIERFSPGLPSTPGWAKFTQEEKDWLQKETSDIIELGQLRGIITINLARKLYGVETWLKERPDKMTMTQYLRSNYSKSENTGRRILREYKQLREHWGDKIIDVLTSRGDKLLRGAVGLELKNWVSLAKQLPPPRSQETKVIEAYISDDVRKAITAKKKKGAGGKEEEQVAKEFANDGIRGIRASGAKTSAERRRIIIKAVGWIMEALAIPGTIRCGRIALPEGVNVPRGRQRLKPQKAA